MSITDRDRKILWGKAGNRCAMCHSVIVQAGQAGGHAVVGEECHIISPRRDGPRGRFEMLGDHDGYDNLILLCPSHHTVIDQLTDDWPPKGLARVKAEHEAWVDRTLTPPQPPAQPGVRRERPQFLHAITTASDLVEVAMGVEESSMDHDDLEDEAEVDLVAGFLQNVFDWSDLWSDMEPGARIRAQFGLGRELASLLEAGWQLFGARGRGMLGGGDGPPSLWETAYLRVVRTTTPLATAEV